MINLFILLVIITSVCWILATVQFHIGYFSFLGINQTDAKVILGLVFWPIGLLYVVILGLISVSRIFVNFKSLVKLVFEKDEN